MRRPTVPRWRQLFSRKIQLPAAVLVVVVSAWEYGVPEMGIQPFILPTPSAIIVAFVENHETILAELQVTIRVFAVAFGLTLVTGYLMALLMFEWKALETTFFPYIIVIRSIPIVTLLPIFITWFGFGGQTVLVVSYLISFFPMVVNTLSGFQETDAQLVEMLESFSASRWEVYRDVYFYSSLPTVFAGIKISVILAFTGTIVGELVLANQGIGALIIEYNSTFATPEMFAAVFTVSLSSLCCFGAVVGLERLFVDWT